MTVRRSALRPFTYVRFTAECWFSSPIIAALLSACGIVSCLALLIAYPSAQISPGAVLVSWILPLLTTPWIVQSMTSRLWCKNNPDQAIPLKLQMQAGWERFWPSIRSTALTLLLAPLGLIVFVVGMPAVLGLGTWRTILVSLLAVRGRDATDQAWEMAGAGGLLWCCISFAAGLLLGLAVAVIAANVIGGVALVLVGPITVGLGISLTTAALLDRRGS